MKEAAQDSKRAPINWTPEHQNVYFWEQFTKMAAKYGNISAIMCKYFVNQ